MWGGVALHTGMNLSMGCLLPSPEKKIVFQRKCHHFKRLDIIKYQADNSAVRMFEILNQIE